MTRRDRFLSALAEDMGCSADVVSTPGVTAIGSPSRAENHVTAGYVLGDHFVITCDPAVEAMLVDATSSMLPSLDAWQEVAVACGGELLGDARMQLLASHDLKAAHVPAGYSLRSLSPANADDFALIERLVESSSEDDLDEAEIALDELDSVIEATIDSSGQIACFASMRPFEMAPEFGDIGIITHADHRGRGLGTATLASLCDRQLSNGIEPLYRCAKDNTGSVALSASYGFEIVTELIAYRFPA